MYRSIGRICTTPRSTGLRHTPRTKVCVRVGVRLWSGARGGLALGDLGVIVRTVPKKSLSGWISRFVPWRAHVPGMRCRS